MWAVDWFVGSRLVCSYGFGLCRVHCCVFMELTCEQKIGLWAVYWFMAKDLACVECIVVFVWNCRVMLK